MAIFIGLRLTVGEANPVVYALMALPAPGWPLLFLLISLIWMVKRKPRVAAIYVVGALAIVFPLLNPSFGSPKSSSARALRVMTFNVQKFHNFAFTEVAAAIRTENPDIVCLQEANFKGPPTPLPLAFLALFKDYKVAQRGQTAILSRFPIHSERVVPLRSGQDGRPAQVLNVMAGDRMVTVVCVHLQYFPWDGSISVAKASKNLMAETRSLEGLVKDISGAVIVAGDFNTLPHGRTHRMMRRYVTDCFGTTATGFGLTLPAVFPLKRLDYIYVGGGLHPLRTRVSGQIASDHLAVVSDLDWE